MNFHERQPLRLKLQDDIIFVEELLLRFGTHLWRVPRRLRPPRRFLPLHQPVLAAT